MIGIVLVVAGVSRDSTGAALMLLTVGIALISASIDALWERLAP